jgi:hypothetical protein
MSATKLAARTPTTDLGGSEYSGKNLTSPKTGVQFPRPKQPQRNGKNARSLLARKVGVFVSGRMKDSGGSGKGVAFPVSPNLIKKRSSLQMRGPPPKPYT